MNLSEMFPISYYVNLDARTDRKEAVEKEFEKVNYKSIRHSARKEVSTTISHLEILEKVVDKGENVLIFEDDAQFVDDQLPYLDAILDELSNVKWDMFFLGANILRPAFQTSKHLARLSQAYSAHAYAIHKDFLPTVTHLVKVNMYQIIDVIYGDFIVPNTRSYLAIPMVCIQAESQSDILKRKADYSIPIERYNRLVIMDDKFKER